MESQNIQLNELMKLRDKLRERERERAKVKKAMWGCFGLTASMIFAWLVEEFFFGKELRHPTLRKLLLGTFITAGVLGLLGSIFCWFVLSKNDKEIANLKKEIKNLENSIR